MEIYRHNLFSTPVTYYESFLPAYIANNITEFILTRKADHIKKHRLIKGDAYSVHNSNNINILKDISFNVSGCSNILDNIQSCVKDYADSIKYPECFLDNSWFNIQGPGSVLLRHSHISIRGAEIISGALYINVDEKSSAISFENPNPFSILIPRNSDNFFNFKPNVGDLILFPSWLVHLSSEPNMTDNRIVISFNTK